jgi:hypothetical protein
VGSHFGRSRRADARLQPGDPLEGLLEEMHDLRMTLAADLTAAAGAADAGADDVAKDIIEADRIELARFARVANIRLERLARNEPEPATTRPAWKRRVAVALPIAPVVGAMALSAAAATGVLPIPGATHSAKPAVVRADGSSAEVSFQKLVTVLNGDPNASQVIAAASKLHHQLRELIATSPNDPSKAAEFAQFLRLEQSLLMSKQPPGVSIVLNATRKLAARLVAAAPGVRNSPSVAPTFVPSAPPTHQQRPHRHTVSTSPSAEPAAPKPANPTPPAQPSPSQKPDPSPSPSGTPFAWPQ